MAKATCTVVDSGVVCGRVASARGMCNMHYLRMKSYGTTDRPPRGSDIHGGTPNKTCRTCEEVKPRSEFGKNSATKDGLLTHCKACAQVQVKLRWQTRKPQMQERDRRARLKKYGITPEYFEALLDFQNGVCAICSGQPNGLRDTFCIDHDHITGEVRGLICHSCNVMLGHAKDDPEVLRAAIRYLERK